MDSCDCKNLYVISTTLTKFMVGQRHPLVG